MISAGRVLLMPKGAYDASTTYELLDIVSYNGSSYIAKGTTTGNLPTNTTYWQLSAYGGNAANVASNFAELETTSIAVAVHNVDDLFIDENSQLMITTHKINIGDSIVSGTNCDPTSVETLINNVATYFANLDAADRKLKAIAEIEVQTDLHTLTIGEYFKSDTSFYVTNAPTGIDSEITAVFRLTVEAAYDDESALNAPMLLTLRTLNGKVYKQAYDGANWSSWSQEATEAEIVGTKGLIANVQATLTANKNYSAGEHFIYQYNEYELDSSVSSGSALVIGTNCHATGDVSSQISSVNEALTNEVSARSQLGAHNLLPYNLSSLKALNTNGTWSDNSYTYNGVTYVVLSDGRIIVTTNGSASTDISNFYFVNEWYKQFSEDTKLSGLEGSSDYYILASIDSSYPTTTNGEISIAANASINYVRIRVASGVTLNKTAKPMLRLATDTDTTYTPYAMTNRELTESKAAKTDLTNINITGTTNSTGLTITSGTYFYLNGTLVKAKADIADGATLTLNTNYEAVPAGGFNVLASSIRLNFQNFGDISSIKTYIEALPDKTVDVKTFYTKPSDGPTGLGNWSYTLVTFKKEDSSSIARTYCLLFYPGKLYVGNLNNDALTWNEITLS